MSGLSQNKQSATLNIFIRGLSTKLAGSGEQCHAASNCLVVFEIRFIV